MITFWVDGIPASQGSKRHVGNGRLIESDKKLPAWRKAIETTVAELHKGDPIDEPVIVRADFYLPKPKKPRWLTPATALDTEDRKSTRLNSSHGEQSRMPSSA